MTPKRFTRGVVFSLLSAALVVAACGDPGSKIINEDEPDPSETPSDDPNEEQSEEEAVCPHVGDPLVDPSSFPPCPSCSVGGAACVPKALLPADKLASFGDCDEANACVPNIIIATRGNFIPDTCDSVFGAEGRCLSKCLPSVAEKGDTLPQSSCDASEACVPCFDPFTQEPTGACDQSCDPGPTEPPVEIASCCSGDGVCLPTDVVGDKADDLGQDNCVQNEGERLCVPSAFLDPNFAPLSCVDEGVFSDSPGACLPSCLPAVQGLLQDLTLDQQGCPANHLCAPCDHPITGDPTGACDL